MIESIPLWGWCVIALAVVACTAVVLAALRLGRGVDDYEEETAALSR